MPGSESGGLPSYRGYEYQIIVSVWVALDLMHRRGLCSFIEIEPASQEDVAAKLCVKDEEAEATVGAEGPEGTIHIQIKHRSKFWNVADFRALLETPEKRGTRGPHPRERALARLQADANLRYLLITDAEVHPDLKALTVDKIGQASSANSIDDLTSAAEVASRIAVIEKRVQRYVEREIDDLLEQFGRVPAGRAPACREEISGSVRRRLLGERESRLTLAEVDEIIERHGGRPPSNGDDFVRPSNYAELENRLEKWPYALLLVGPPGIGKTYVALQLLQAHRRMERPFEVLKDPRPYDVRAALQRSGRVLFYFEDPWGTYKLTQDASMWVDELPRLIIEANGSPDKRFLITSRTGLFADAAGFLGSQQAKGKVQRAFGAYVASIHEDHFDTHARTEILHRQMRNARRWQKDWVTDNAKTVVKALTVPQAIVSFMNQVKQLSAASRPKLETLLKESQVEAIGNVVARQVRELEAAMSAVVLWAFLTTNVALTEAFARNVSIRMYEGARLDLDVPRLMRFLVESGWLTYRGDVITAHPSVIAGLEKVVDAEPVKSDRVLRALFEALLHENQMQTAMRSTYPREGV